MTLATTCGGASGPVVGRCIGHRSILDRPEPTEILVDRSAIHAQKAGDFPYSWNGGELRDVHSFRLPSGRPRLLRRFNTAEYVRSSFSAASLAVCDRRISSSASVHGTPAAGGRVPRRL